MSYTAIFFGISFGLIFGSFLNALIYRIPKGIGLFLPRSFCPKCKKTIPWYENIPLLSYLLLRGACSNCKTSIPKQYPLIEILTGFASLFLWPNNFEAVTILNFTFYFSIFCIFITHFCIDLEHKILPNILNLYLGIIFLTFSIMFKNWQFWLYGSLVGVLFPLSVTWLFYLAKKKEGLGMGDIKLFGILGLHLGPMGIIQNIFFSCLGGSIIGFFLILIKKLKRESEMPFGPFIILVASLQIFFPKFFESFLKIF